MRRRLYERALSKCCFFFRVRVEKAGAGGSGAVVLS
jgi:hypothetical protein